MNAVVFASGNGSNFEALLEHEKAGRLDVNIKALAVDKENAYARQRARSHGVPERYFNPKDYPSKREYEQDILKWLKELDADMIILSGYMRYIGEVLLEAYPKAIVNLHPAWLPEFPGAHGIEDAYNAKVSQTGVTVHFVDEGVDTGPVILQKRLVIDPNWSLEQLESHVHELEHDLFYQGINLAAKDIERRQK